MTRRTDTIVVGAGQAGLGLSHYLAAAGHAHVLLERGRVGERWRSERWDSLSLLTPAWLSALPGSTHAEADGFLPRADFVRYLEEYASSIGAPVRKRTAVTSLTREGAGFRVGSDGGTWRAWRVVIASGDCDVPRLLGAAASAPRGIRQLHSSRYRSPEALPAGAVLVAGAGPSGQQIALELARAGREVVLAVGRHSRSPRAYRARDIFHWLHALGDLDEGLDDVHDPEASRRAPSFPLSGSHGGEQIDLGVLQAAGVRLGGRIERFEGARTLFGDNLAGDVAEAESRMRRFLARVDEHAARLGEGPVTETLPEVSLGPAVRELDLSRLRVRSIVWATGFTRAYPWLAIPGALDARGEIRQRNGVAAVPGLYTLGLRFQRLRKSHFVGGVGDDAAFLAGRILGSSTVLSEAA